MEDSILYVPIHNQGTKRLKHNLQATVFTSPASIGSHIELAIQGNCLDKAPRLSIRIVILILPSDTETSAATPCEVMRKK